MERKILEVLDRIESMRIRAIENPNHYTADYVLRVAEGIISSEFGFGSRLAWMDALKKIPTSDLAKRTRGL